MPSEKKKTSGCVKVLIVFLLLLLAVLVVLLAIGVSSSPSSSGSASSVSKAKNTSLLASELDLSEAQETALLDIFSQCGIGEIVKAQKFQSGEGHTSYWLDDQETQSYRSADFRIVVWLTDDQKTLESIYFHDYDIYVDGTVLDNIQNYYVNAESRDQYRLLTQMAVNKTLSYPDEAKYQTISHWAFEKRDGLVYVQSSVTAKNALGVQSTVQFQSTFNGETMTSLIVDGTEYLQ